LRQALQRLLDDLSGGKLTAVTKGDLAGAGEAQGFASCAARRTENIATKPTDTTRRRTLTLL